VKDPAVGGFIRHVFAQPANALVQNLD
jgi:hypothetical protein